MASKNKKKINILVSNYNNKTKEEIVQVNIYKYMYIYYISYYINILLYIYIYIYILNIYRLCDSLFLHRDLPPTDKIDLIQSYENEESFTEVSTERELKPRHLRSVCLVSYSQTEFKNTPSREISIETGAQFYLYQYCLLPHSLSSALHFFPPFSCFRCSGLVSWV